MLNIVDTLKKIRTILLGYRIEIHTDQNILVHKTLLILSDGVMQRQLIIEEYDPKVFHILGTNNVIINALIRLLMMVEVPDKDDLSKDV